MLEIFELVGGEMILSLVLAAGLSACLGLESNLANKMSETRTFALIGLGAALFAIISNQVTERTLGVINFDPLRMASLVVMGVGFLGAGIIIARADKTSGLTTTAGLWLAAGVGLACGFELYHLALLATGLATFIFALLWIIERDFIGDLQNKEGNKGKARNQ